MSFATTARGHALAAWRNLRGLLLFLVLMSLFRSAVADHMRVPTGSMNPTVVEGDQILVNKMAYGLRIPFTHVWLYQGEGPRRGDIITFDSPEDGETWLKRVVGLPGDTVEMRDEAVIINGKPLAYKAGDAGLAAQMTDSARRFHLEFADEQLGEVSHSIMIMPEVASPVRSFKPITIPPGQYMLMGDNRDNSKDSRYIGTIERGLITGHAGAILLSLDEEHSFMPRGSRFVKKLK
ncbi:MAG: family signal peptidase [Betaproteobacteria bacterium]|nr:family signal peptidase [Betaproteobacteria bacterium]